MKTIKAKMILSIESIILTIIVGLTIISLMMSSSALMKTVYKTMPAIAVQAANVVQSRTSEQLRIIELIAARETIASSSVGPEIKLSLLQSYVEKYKYIKVGIADLNGEIKFSNGTSTNIAERDYFKKALNGESNVSDPLMSKTENQIVVVYATPIKENGQVIGVLTATKAGNEISSIVNDITFGETGKAFMLASSGVKIAHYDNELVLKQDNDLENAKTDKSLKELAALQEKMIKGETGSGVYHYNGAAKFLTFAPVPSTTWSIAVVVEQSEVLSELNALIGLLIILAILFIAVSTGVVYLIAQNLSSRVKAATGYIVPMASGDFSDTISNAHFSMIDDLGQMIQAVDIMQVSVRTMLHSVTNNSAKINEDSKNLSAVSEEMSSVTGSVAVAVQEVAKGPTSADTALSSSYDVFSGFSANLVAIA